ncbi:MAG: hypothetical protein ABDH19_03235 [Thermodesulfovibrio sp.]
MRKIIVIIISLLIVSCGGKKQLKPPSEEYSYTQEAFKVIDEIRVSYQKKDNAGIRKNCSEAAYREIIASIKPFDRVELEFIPVLVEIEADSIKVYVSWNGKWSYLGRETEERGLASFLLKGNPPKVERIIRGSPFRYPD